ncbi:TraR/DksA C4-type zinc finger protein [Candidatus Parcubacteria bacterium]|nr:TraR/DksA C4-type zinc finger protein [Candidatus Parcubacteria bacterium]
MTELFPPETIARLKQKLATEEQAVREELGAIATKNPRVKGDFTVTYPEFGNDVELDEDADEVEEFSNVLALEQRLENRLGLITRALAKIEGGQYGLCERCGKPIDPARLEAMPEAAACLKCE